MRFTINPLSPALGAEIVGADLSRPLADAGFAEIREALTTHQMLAIRDQRIGPRELLEFSGRFGAVAESDNRNYLLDGHPKILVLSNDRDAEGRPIGVPDAGDAWHSDHSYKRETAFVTLLHARRLPREGGDTEFANQAAAYDSLPEATKRRIAGLRAIHTVNKLRNPRIVISAARENAAAFYEGQGARFPDITHPIVRTHPETGRKLLFVSPRFTIGVAGLDEAEGQALLDELFAHQAAPAFVHRHRWRDNDLVLWDNRAVTHRACGGYAYPDIRTIYRTTVMGDAPY